MELAVEHQRLIEAADQAVRDHGEVPRHTVGAALRTRDGEIITGVNVFAQGGGACAELVARGTAISHGHRDFAAIVAVGDQDRGVIGPCGVCRQLLLDYAPNITVILPDAGGLSLATPSELLPNSRRSWFAP